MTNNNDNRMKTFTKTLLGISVAAGLLGLTACNQSEPVAQQAAKAATVISPQYTSFSDVKGGQAQPFDNGWLVTSEKQGLLIVSNNKDPKGKLWLKGEFTLLGIHDDLVVTYDRRNDQVQPILVKDGKPDVQVQLPKRDFEINWLCMQPRKADGLTYAWFGSEHGIAEQWLLSNGKEFKPRLVRKLSVPVGSLDCAYDANSDSLYIAEQNAGIWKYSAQPEAANETELVVSKPNNKITSLFELNGNLLYQNESGDIFDLEGQVAKISGDEVEKLTARNVGNEVEIVSFDDEVDSYRFASLNLELPKPVNKESLISEIPAWVESGTSDRSGDTMDDPAIWVHPTSPEKSLILGAQKRWGLQVFDMTGQEVQSIATGRINNVDIRQGITINGNKHDIAVASLRDGDRLAFYDVSSNGKVTELAKLTTDLSDIYGMCLYNDGSHLFALANEKSGKTIQYKVSWKGMKPSIENIRTLSAPSQVEGCVADDNTGDLFIGEEDTGIWHFSAKPEASTQGSLILKADGKQLVADVEGLALYHGKDETYLVASSQGNDSYVIYDAKAPYTFKGHFRIGTNFDTGIDGSSETDGLAVTSKAVGSGAWQQGMLAVQDGRNRLPDGNQVFKWVPWSEINKLLVK
ncbi:phytase [Parashewanella tropica]|uniref:phytase n=1 Tax=Parashewanella tropica TaxID=2547970 RepID=UPI001FE51516|nr:phytase [Parashewanella tropica]